MEYWRTIRKAPRYEVSNLGRVRNKKSGLVLRPRLDRYGYLKLVLVSENGYRYYATVHRLVAEAWVYGFSKGLQVNHKNGVKTDNRPSNLEWTTSQENVIHSYENDLNNNKFPAILHDILTDETYSFRSIKSLSKALGLYSSTVMPLIRNSFDCPILGRYVVEVKDLKSFAEASNVTNFGRSVFVYDHILEQKRVYPSSMIAAYFTGIKSLNNLKSRKIINCAAYSASLEDIEFVTSEKDYEDLLIERLRYINTPYQKMDHLYILYDYCTDSEYDFTHIEDVVEFINDVNPGRPVKSRSITNAIQDGHSLNKSGLLRGFGIKSSKHDFPWYPYTEEKILRDKTGEKVYKAYRIKTDSFEEVVFGIVNVCKLLEYKPDKPYSSLKIEDILDSSDIPNLSITRLNKPIEVKD